jgi:hypothetical protein
VDILQTLIERWGFPIAFSVWLMKMYTRELRDMRSELKRIAIAVAVMAKTLDVPTEVAALEEGKEPDLDPEKEK